MSTDNVNRDASATILGFLYQFDATILSILELEEAESLTVEGIEDFDVFHNDMTSLFQCKYYEATRLTHATIRDAILPMIRGFTTRQQGAHRKAIPSLWLFQRLHT